MKHLRHEQLLEVGLAVIHAIQSSVLAKGERAVAVGTPEGNEPLQRGLLPDKTAWNESNIFSKSFFFFLRFWVMKFNLGEKLEESENVLEAAGLVEDLAVSSNFLSGVHSLATNVALISAH